MGTEVVLSNLVDERSRSDPLSMVNQAEIIDRSWLRRVEWNLLHDAPTLQRAIERTPVVPVVTDFRARVDEIRNSDGKRVQEADHDGTTYIYEQLLVLTRRLIAALLAVVQALLEFWLPEPLTT